MMIVTEESNRLTVRDGAAITMVLDELRRATISPEAMMLMSDDEDKMPSVSW